MKSYTRLIWKKVIAKLGSVATMIKPVASQIKVAIDAEDLTKLRAIATEGLEACEAESKFYRAMLEDTEDGNLDLVEGANLVVLLEEMIDQREDQFTGKDEDKAPPVAAKKKAAKKKAAKKKK